ncbi:oligosaccharide flippase family protein [Streptomyces sp. V1I6]|uniref:oligosaccharide flippase family protein n=1 Tax=Streptomyces sp. V1I6 TaxID=3042273 RepID=UPI0027D7E8A0|nr:oligosaccharide flippase family protein [Streptomyces sp. V1I6]
MAQRIVGALSWNYGGAAASVALQLGYTAYTARAVGHGAFGSYAIALSLVQLFGLFAAAGLTTCVLRAERLTRATVRAALRLGLLTGLGCWLLLQASAPLAAQFWHMPELTTTLRLLGCQYLVQPACGVLLSALRRCGRHSQAVLAELGGQAVGSAVAAVVLACTGSPYALALAAPAAAVATLVWVAPAMVRLALPSGQPPRARELVGLSGFLSGFALLRQTAASAPLWAAGLLLGPAAAGLYSRAQLLADIPLNFLVRGLNQAAVPMLAEHRKSDRPLKGPARYLLYGASAGFIAFGVLAGAGPSALALLLGPGWEGAAALVPPLACCAALQLVYAAGCSLDLARDARRDLVRTQVVLLTATTVALAAAVRWPGTPLIIAAVSAGPAAGHAVQLIRWQRCGIADAADVVRAHLVHATAGVCLAAAGLWGGGHGGLPAAVLAMVPVVSVCVLLRGRLPAVRAATRLGLLPTRRKEPECVTP